MSITKLTLKDIKNKYEYTTNELMLHYGVLSGEIPNDLIERMLNSNTKTNIFIRKSSKIHGCFKYKKKDNVSGYQILKKGKRYFYNILLETSENAGGGRIDKLFQYLLCDKTKNNSKNFTTNDVGRRKTFHKLCKLYYLLDTLNINYLPSYRKPLENITFYTGRELNIEFAEQSSVNSDHRLRGTKIKGVLQCYNNFYNVFLYDNDIIKLYHKEEIRIANDIRIYFERQYKNYIKTGTVIICKNLYMQEKIINHLIEITGYKPNKTYSASENYNYYRDFNHAAGIHIISFDEIGEKQLFMLCEKEKINEYIDKNFCKPLKLDADGYKRCNGIICDGNYNDTPCYFLYSLDFSKISKILKNIKRNKISIICLREHYKIINSIFYPYLANCTILPFDFE